MTIEKRTKYLSVGIVILTLVMVFLPAQVAIPSIKKIIIGCTGGLSFLGQGYLLMNSKPGSEKNWSYALIVLTIAAIVLMFFGL